MKNINRYLLILSAFILALIFTGCSNNTNDVNNLNTFGDIEDINTSIASEYGHSPCNPPENFTYYYKGGVLSIPYTFYGGHVESEAGLFYRWHSTELFNRWLSK